jgi:hypothetical protein
MRHCRAGSGHASPGREAHPQSGRAEQHHPLAEARDNSAIENIVTTNDKLFRYASADPEKADDATEETLRYRAAPFQGHRDIQKRPLTTNIAISICRAIKNVELDLRRIRAPS